MKHVYLSGGITGVKDYEKRFKEAEKRVMCEMQIHSGCVFNPADNKITQLVEQRYCSKSWYSYMKYLIAKLAEQDAIIMLPRWYLSRGARIEWYLAKFVFKLEVKYIKRGKIV